jgi:hypothetical protein
MGVNSAYLSLVGEMGAELMMPNNVVADSCEYCGNGSGMLDSRGNCIACGAPLNRSYQSRPTFIFTAPALPPARGVCLSENIK